MKIFDYNKKIHDKLYKKYNKTHSEIYNKIEQNRLDKLIIKLINLYGKNNSINVLDVGSGTGNLSHYFLKNNCKITALDVSEKSLLFLKQRFKNYSNNINTKLIESDNLPFEDNSFSITATYSVLHHIPNYLNTVKEMIRVTVKGGFIYIDHEANENKRNKSKILYEYYNLGNEKTINKLKRLFIGLEILDFQKWKALFISKFINPKFQIEGDIHVWPDDHIEWELIKKIAIENNCEIVEEVDYLLYNSKIDLDIFNQYKNIVNDTKYIIFKKL